MWLHHSCTWKVHNLVFFFGMLSLTHFVFYLCFWSLVVSIFYILLPRQLVLQYGPCIQRNRCCPQLCSVCPVVHLHGLAQHDLAPRLLFLSSQHWEICFQPRMGKRRPFLVPSPGPLSKLSLTASVSPSHFSQAYFSTDLCRWLSHSSVPSQMWTGLWRQWSCQSCCTWYHQCPYGA